MYHTYRKMPTPFHQAQQRQPAHGQHLTPLHLHDSSLIRQSGPQPQPARSATLLRAVPSESPPQAARSRLPCQHIIPKAAPSARRSQIVTSNYPLKPIKTIPPSGSPHPRPLYPAKKLSISLLSCYSHYPSP